MDDGVQPEIIDLDHLELQRLAATPEGVRTHGGALARSSDAYVRYLVASSPYAPVDALSVLVFDSDERVREKARYHLRRPLPAVKEAADEEEDRGSARELIRRFEYTTALKPERAIRRALGRLLHEAGGLWTVIDFVAAHQLTAARDLLALAEHSDAAVRLLVAGNSSTPSSALAVLAADPFADIRKAVAGNRSTPPVVLARLMGDVFVEVRQAATSNPNLPSVRSIEEHLAVRGAPSRVGEAEPYRALPLHVDLSMVEASPELRVVLDRRSITEQHAICTVAAYEQRNHRTVHGMPQNHKGFDLLSVDAEGNARFIEVKGVGQHSKHVTVSAAQLERAAQYAETTYWAIVLMTEEQPVELLMIHSPWLIKLPGSVAAVRFDVAALRASAQDQVIVVRARPEGAPPIRGGLFEGPH